MPYQSDSALDFSRPMVCEIRIKGHLTHHWSDWFDGMAMTLEEHGETLFSGLVADQAALLGLLRRVRDAGMPLLSVVCVAPDETRTSVED